MRKHCNSGSHNFAKKSIRGVVIARSYSRLSLAMDFAQDLAKDLVQMVLEVRQLLQPTQFIIPNSFCFYKFAKKSIPWVPWVILPHCH